MNRKTFSRRDFLKGSAAAAAGSALFGLMNGLGGTAFAEEAAETPAGAEDLYILYTNDVHCGVDDNIGYLGLLEAKNALLGAGKNILMVDAGDFIQGGTMGAVSKGSYIVDIMNQIGYDAVTLGNHEFDYGMEVLMDRVKQLNCPVVCSNFTGPEGEVFYPYRIFEKAGRKVAFVGATTPTTISTSSPSQFRDADGNVIYDFCNDKTGGKLIECLQKNVDAARAEGADLVVILGHIGISEKEIEDDIHGNVQSDKLIAGLSGVDLFIDGHSHTVMPSQLVPDKDGKEVPLTQTGTKLAYIGLAVVSASGEITTQLLDDAGLKVLLSQINTELDEELKQVVGSTEYDLVVNDPANPDTRIVRTEETNLGDLCADAMRVYCSADIGLVNGGGCRAPIAAGDITTENLLSVFPFNNELCVRSVKGSVLLDALELSVSQLPNEFGGFQQVSGISFTVNTQIESPVILDEYNQFQGVEGERRVKDVDVAGEPLDEEKYYSVATNSYILKQGGNGYTMFNDCPFILESGPSDLQALISYVQDTLGGKIGEEYENPYGAARMIFE